MLYKTAQLSCIVYSNIVSASYCDADDFDTPSFKWASFEYAMLRSNFYVSNLLRQIRLVGGKENVYVDVKVHNLKVGDVPALPNYHIDCCDNPVKSPPDDVHHLFIGGLYETAMTEFVEVLEHLDIPEKGKVNWDRVLSNPNIMLNSVRIPLNTIVTYSSHIHRAVPSVSEGPRLLIRVTETNKVYNRDRNYTPTITRKNKYA